MATLRCKELVGAMVDNVPEGSGHVPSSHQPRASVRAKLEYLARIILKDQMRAKTLLASPWFRLEATALLKTDDKVLLEYDEVDGLWTLPTASVQRGQHPGDALKEKLRKIGVNQNPNAELDTSDENSHVIVSHKGKVIRTIYQGENPQFNSIKGSNFGWHSISDLPELTMSTADALDKHGITSARGEKPKKNYYQRLTRAVNNHRARLRNPYTVGASALITNSYGEGATVWNHEGDPGGVAPGGLLDRRLTLRSFLRPRELPVQAARRELREETGLAENVTWESQPWPIAQIYPDRGQVYLAYTGTVDERPALQKPPGRELKQLAWMKPGDLSKSSPLKKLHDIAQHRKQGGGPVNK